MFGGLANIGGTTCALNTLVQIIAHSNHLFNALCESFKYNKECEEKTLVWNITYISEALRNSFSVTPGGLVRLLYELFPNDFHPGEQMDIYELWTLMATKISEEVPMQQEEIINHPANITREVSTKVSESISKINNGTSSVWLTTIQSIQLGILKCLNTQCGATPYNVEVYTSFEVDIPFVNDTHTAYDLDKLLLKNHMMETMDMWKCDKCSHVGGMKQSQLYTVPRVLVVVLKRFQMTTSGTFSKINTPINISKNINITLNDVSTNYNLIGIANHYGVYGGGHYTAHVLETNTWVCFDDANRSIINTETHNIFSNNRDAYMLFYETI